MRFYDAGIGRFLQRDFKKTEFNPYVYASNAAPIAVDPTGLNRYWEWSWWDVIPGVQVVHLVHDVVTAPVALGEDIVVALEKTDLARDLQDLAKRHGYANLSDMNLALGIGGTTTSGPIETIQAMAHVGKALVRLGLTANLLAFNAALISAAAGSAVTQTTTRTQCVNGKQYEVINQYRKAPGRDAGVSVTRTVREGGQTISVEHAVFSSDGSKILHYHATGVGRHGGTMPIEGVYPPR